MHDEEFHDFDAWEPLDNEVTAEIEGIERFTLRSVGIDIGSSTTHSVFSRLILRREGGGLSARYVVTNREVIYRSPILLTPYSSATAIDTDQVTKFIEHSYQEAGLTPADIDTGAIVITGEALKKENAQPILEYFSNNGGRFICASAGPMHEALLAAYGSGAVNISKHHDKAVLNVDIGGGTTKLSLISRGKIVQMVAVEIGARLIAFDEDMTILRVEQPARTILKALGHSINVGEKLPRELCKKFAQKMVDILFDVISGGELDQLTGSLMLSEGLKDHSKEKIDHLVYSGGVSEYIYNKSPDEHGDVGPMLGLAVRGRTQLTFKKGVLMKPNEGIRATVIGAGEYTLQASGSTSYIATLDVLPIRGVQVAHAVINKTESSEEISQSIKESLIKYDLNRLSENVVMALSIDGQPDYPYIQRIAQCIAGVAAPQGNQGEPLFLMLDVDVAKSLGSILSEELKLKRSIIAIDGIEVGDLDYVDIGMPMGASDVIPVTVKSLIFSTRSKSG